MVGGSAAVVFLVQTCDVVGLFSWLLLPAHLSAWFLCVVVLLSIPVGLARLLGDF